MAEIVRMPKMSDTMTEGVVSKWHKKVGDKVKTGDLVADIETDKATMEFESYQEGVLLYIGVLEGKAAPVDDILAILGKEGEDYKSLLDAEKKKAADGSSRKQEENKTELKKEVVAEKKADAASAPPKPAPAPVVAGGLPLHSAQRRVAIRQSCREPVPEGREPPR